MSTTKKIRITDLAKPVLSEVEQRLVDSAPEVTLSVDVVLKAASERTGLGNFCAEDFKERLGLDYPLSSVLIAGGARPMIAGTYYALVNPKDAVVYSVPSWNNNHYCSLTGAERIEVPATAETGFFPRVTDLAPYLERARLIVINTPLNPTGTLMAREDLKALSLAIVAENKRRQAVKQPALYLMFDQVYWMLTAPGRTHETPVGLVPEMAPYSAECRLVLRTMAEVDGDDGRLGEALAVLREWVR